jgi:hypothetical protein
MKIGDIEIENAILNLEHDMIVIQMYLDAIMEKNPSIKRPTRAEIEEYKRIAIKRLQVKYPNMGVSQK